MTRMIKQEYYRPLLLILIQLLVQTGMAQGGASIKASVDKNKILLGEPFQLTVEAHLSPESVISFPTIDSIAHFEPVDKPNIDTVTSVGTTTIKAVYTITSFDSGHWVIPSFALSKGARTDSIPIDVVFADFNPEQDYHDIKDVVDVTPDQPKKQWWYLAVAAVLALLLIVYVLRRKKPAAPPAPKAAIDPFTEAMNSLQQLQQSKPATKQYYTGLVDIFKLYVFRKKELLSLQKTTDDLVLQLKVLELGKTSFDKLAQALRLSDFVKFARFIPSAEDDRNSYMAIREAIDEIERMK